MSFGNTFETDLLGLIFNGDAIANLADDAGASPLTDLYVSLHTADPGEAGTQDTSECAYTNYARQAVPRDNTGFTVSGNQVTLAAAVAFPAGESGDNETVTHFAIGVASAGTTKILASGAVSPNISVTDGVTPRLTTGTTLTLD